MATAGIVVCSSYGMSCIECNELLIAPESSATSAIMKFAICGLAIIAVRDRVSGQSAY